MLRDLSESQRGLAEYMSSISEDAYAAGWIEGLEFDLWRAVQEGPFRYGRLLLTSAHTARLTELSAACDGWIRFDEQIEEQFVPIEVWETLATAK